jgi:hypothetical protein
MQRLENKYGGDGEPETGAVNTDFADAVTDDVSPEPVDISLP